MHTQEQLSPSKAKLIELQRNLRAQEARQIQSASLIYEPAVRRVMKVSRGYIDIAVREGWMLSPVQQEPRAWSYDRLWTWWYRTQRDHQQLLKSDWKGNASASRKTNVNYRMLTQQMVERRAALHGCQLSHTLTVAFKDQRSSVLTESQVLRWNDQHEAQVRIVSKFLAQKVWRRFLRIDNVPDDLFLYVICPERKTKSGSPALWHLHIDLYLRPFEARLLNRYFHRIRECIEHRFGKMSDDLHVEAHLQEVDSGFRGYSHKNAFDNIDLICSNFL